LLTCVFAQENKSRSEFFKEFYGTYIRSSDIGIGTKEKEEAPEADLSGVIQQLESRYDIDIPASEEKKFKTAEDVAEYVNRYLQRQSGTAEETREAAAPAEKRKKHSWKMKLYGYYGAPEPVGVTGNEGFDGNLFGTQAFKNFNEMSTWEAGFAFHPYGWNGRDPKSGNSWGFSFDHATFSQWGPDSTFSGFESDTANASRYAICLNFQQDITGRKKARPKVGFYFMESFRFGVHNFRHTNADLWGNNHLSYGLGLAQGMYFYIFDLKFYQTLAFSPDILNVRPDLSLINSLDAEIGLRLGVALKF
jgi:hypothetical protein